MIRHIRETVARRRGVELESGFTLIELLIVIVVLGILAATVVFALSGVTSQSATAACQSDAKSYEVAVSAYADSPQNLSNTQPTTTNQLTGTANGGPFLHAAANNTAYAIAIANSTAGDTGSGSGVNNWSGTPALPTPTTATTQVYVLDKENTGAALVWVPYDSEGAGGCASTNL
jgi:prepilin-type N-terminal cleavage/methylation domain-containing protein